MKFAGSRHSIEESPVTNPEPFTVMELIAARPVDDGFSEVNAGVGLRSETQLSAFDLPPPGPD